MATRESYRGSLINKTCRKCDTAKPVEGFSKRSASPDGLAPHCKPCVKKYQRGYYIANQDKFLQWSREQRVGLTDEQRVRYRRSQREKLYGLEPGQYEDMLGAQLYRCAICGTHTDDCARQLAVDHDHDTGEVRGLLCGSCNAAIGLMREDSFVFESAMAYLSNAKVSA